MLPRCLLMLAVLGLVWIAAVRDAGRDQLLVGAAVGITGVVAHAMLDWDFQSYFLPLMVAVLCGVAVSALAGHDIWLLRPWRRAPAGVQTASRVGRQAAHGLALSDYRGNVTVHRTGSFVDDGALVAEKGIAAYEAGATADADRFFSISQRLNSLNAEYPYLRAKTNVAQPGRRQCTVGRSSRTGRLRAGP